MESELSLIHIYSYRLYQGLALLCAAYLAGVIITLFVVVERRLLR